MRQLLLLLLLLGVGSPCLAETTLFSLSYHDWLPESSWNLEIKSDCKAVLTRGDKIFRKTLPPKDVQAMLEQVEASGFSDLKPEYQIDARNYRPDSKAGASPADIPRSFRMDVHS